MRLVKLANDILANPSCALWILASALLNKASLGLDTDYECYYQSSMCKIQRNLY